MDSLIIEPTTSSPYINFDPSTGRFEISGRSTPEHPSEFYSVVHLWINQYVKKPRAKTFVQINFEYFNTSSSKYVLDLLKKLLIVHQAGKEVVVQWYYEEEDVDMREAGLDFGQLLKIPFDMVQK